MKVLENIKNNRILFILFVLILVCILILITRLTQSYFQAQVDDTHVIDSDVEADLVDNLEFIEGDPLSLTVNPTTLPQNGSNLTSTSKPKARLTTSSTTSVTYNYYVYFKISNNTFEYTNGTTPEIILTIKNPSNTTITSISGLTYVTQNGVSGFDVTEYNGIIPIASNYAISGTSSTSPVTQEWTFTLTFINLTTDQNANMDKTLDTDIIFRKTEMGPLLADVVKNAWVSNSDDAIIIKHDGTVRYSNTVYDAEDNSYRYTGGDYDVTQTAINAGYDYVNKIETFIGGVISVNCNGSDQYVGYYNSSCSTKYYYLQYDTNVTQYSTYDAAIAKAITDGYIVARNLNNYVCFGYDTSVAANETTCPSDNLYRMIGAFVNGSGEYEVKIIKAEYASTTEFGTNAQNGTSSNNSDITANRYTGYTGNKSSVNSFMWYGTLTNSSNRWDNSTFRSGVLNGYYLNTYLDGNDTKWKNMLEETTYYLGGPGKSGYTGSNAKAYYNIERNSEAVYDTATYPASINNYIGLMYLSDYGFARKKSLWTYPTSTINSNGCNWLYNGISDYLLTPHSNNTTLVHTVENTGAASTYGVTNGRPIRPVMYLNSGVEVLRGLGTKASPYYITLSS